MNRTLCFFCVHALGLIASGCVVAPRITDAGVGVDSPFIFPDAGPRPDSPPAVDAPVSCDVGFTSCSGSCVRVATDNMNCGSCGVVCATGTSCAIGLCDCLAPMLACGGACLDPMTNPMHCGTCGNACAATDVCSMGECIVRCEGTGRGICVVTPAGGEPTQICAEFMTDNLNCGTCGTRCSGGTTCQAGLCTCPTGQVSCGSGCVDLMTDAANCGSCLATCGSGGTCAAGVCTMCGTGLDRCGTPARCVNTATSSLHCGMCGRACRGAEACRGGRCECTGGLTDCGAGCTDLTSDVNNCGTCGVGCGAGGVCTTGACVCAAGLTMCGPACSDLTRDRAHCGDCTTACGMGEACQAGVCVLADSFRVLSFSATNCRTIDHSISGDDRGGVAVSPTQFFVTGDSSTVRMSSSDLSGLAAVGVVHDGLIGDLESEQVYALLSATGTEITGGTGMIAQLGLIDGTTGVLGATRIPLSMPITVAYGTAIMSGYAEALIGVPAAGSLQWYQIEFPSGVVNVLGTTPNPTHRSCENWAWWGVAEFFGDVHYATYVESSTQIVRREIPRTGTTTTVPTLVSAFTNLGDMCSITFSTSRNRWYFHHEYNSQFNSATSGEVAGYCDGTFDRP